MTAFDLRLAENAKPKKVSLFGAFLSDKSADVLINEIRSARTINCRKIDEF